MEAKFRCPKCRKPVKVDSKHAGKQAKCPGCGAPLRIPSLEQIQAAQTKRAQPAAAGHPSMDRANAPLPQVPANTLSSDFARKDTPSNVDTLPSLSSADPPQEPTETGTYAGIGQRFVALAIDQVISLGLLMVSAFVLGGILSLLGVRDSAWLVPLILAYVVGIPWLYNATLESSVLQATVGKWLLRIRVTDVDRNRIGFGRATGRYFGKRLSGLSLCIGYLTALFTKNKQALHDLLASTLVIQGRAETASHSAVTEAAGMIT